MNVVVVGGGIAGLTAAHELAERRFKVWVVEPTQDIDRHGKLRMALGGMARTQYFCLDKTTTQRCLKFAPTRPYLASMSFAQDQVAGLDLARLERLASFARRGDRVTIQYVPPSAVTRPVCSWGCHDGRQGSRWRRLACSLLRIVASFFSWVWSVLSRRAAGLAWWRDVRPDPETEPAAVTRLKQLLEPTIGREHIDVLRRPFVCASPDGEKGPHGAVVLVWRSRLRVDETHGLHHDDRTELYVRLQGLQVSTNIKVRYLHRQLGDGDHGPVGVETATQQVVSAIKAAGGRACLERVDGAVEAKRGLVDDGDPVPKDVVELYAETQVGLGPGGLTAAGHITWTEFRRRLSTHDTVAVHPTIECEPRTRHPGLDKIMESLEMSPATGWLAGTQAAVGAAVPDPDCHIAPGEHGFRLFFSYYRHLRSTLERIPVFETDAKHNPQLTDKLSGRTVVDNLVNTNVQAFAGSGSSPVLFPRSAKVAIVAIIRQLHEMLSNRGYDLMDIHQFTHRLVRYMLTGSKRRDAEFEDVSWWDYLRAYDPRTGMRHFRYSDTFETDITGGARVLAAFDGEWGDARTNGNTFVQLLLNQLIESDDVDQVMNAPTTEGWFEHWEKYLREYLDVTFVQAKLTKLSVVESPNGCTWVQPKFESVVGAPTSDNRADSTLPMIEPAFPALVQLSTRVWGTGDGKVDGPGRIIVGDARTLDGVGQGDVLHIRRGPLQGDHEIRKVDGNVVEVRPHGFDWVKGEVDFEVLADVRAEKADYYVMAVDAPACEQLTREIDAAKRVGVANEIQGFASIIRSTPAGVAPRGRPADVKPQRHRTDRRYGSEPWDRFQTLTGIQFYFDNVVRIFDGHVIFLDAGWRLSSINQQQFWQRHPISDGAPYRGVLSVDIGLFDPAWGLSADDIARVVWKQIKAQLSDYWSVPRGSSIANALEPDWFHLDRYIKLEGHGQNLAPYLIPIVGDWRCRPGADPWDPADGLRSLRPVRQTANLWQAPGGGYRLHWGQWLFAGVHHRHFTRMTTMEAANESARHAVNAILNHRWYLDAVGEAPPTEPRRRSRRRYRHEADAFDAHASYLPTPNGDYCHIWDPEAYEYPALVPLRELDDWLFEHGLPHVADWTGLETMQTILSQVPRPRELGLPAWSDILRVIAPFTWPSFRSGGEPYRPSST